MKRQSDFRGIPRGPLRWAPANPPPTGGPNDAFLNRIVNRNDNEKSRGAILGFWGVSEPECMDGHGVA